MTIARFGLIIEWNDDGKLFLDAENRKLPRDLTIMMLYSFIKKLEKEYLDNSHNNITLRELP